MKLIHTQNIYNNNNFTSIIYLDFGRDIEPVLNVIYIFKVDFSIFEKSGSETYVKISDDFIFNILCQTDFMLYFSLPLPESCSFSCHGWMSTWVGVQGSPFVMNGSKCKRMRCIRERRGMARKRLHSSASFDIHKVFITNTVVWSSSRKIGSLFTYFTLTNDSVIKLENCIYRNVKLCCVLR